jgi:hypothetical protein
VFVVLAPGGDRIYRGVQWFHEPLSLVRVWSPPDGASRLAHRLSQTHWSARPACGFLYHFLVGSEYTMVSTLLPALLRVADSQGYNPAAVGMLWTFAGGGKLFMYQQYFGHF